MPSVVNPWLGKASQDINAKAVERGLGQPISGIEILSFFSFVQRFQSGSDVYWSLSNGAHEVHGEIKRKYNMWLGADGFLGFPQTDEIVTPDGSGRFNHFDGGSIYWTDHTGPMTVSGPIRDVWAILGWERGVLGYPVTDEVRWRTFDPSVDQFIAWNLFQNGAIVTSKDMPGRSRQAATAHITPEQLRYLVHRAADTAVHKLPNNIGLYPDIETINISDWEGDFIRSKSRAITFKLHGFHDNGLLFGDTEFHFWFSLRFALSLEASFTDPWFRSLHVELIPGSAGIDVHGISGWFVSGDDYKQKIEDGFKQLADVGLFPVTTSTDPEKPLPHNQAKLVIIDIITSATGGIDIMLSPEGPAPNLFEGSFEPSVQRYIDDFVSNF